MMEQFKNLLQDLQYDVCIFYNPNSIYVKEMKDLINMNFNNVSYIPQEALDEDKIYIIPRDKEQLIIKYQIKDDTK